ncbi:MAG: hypothetical protein LUD15_09680 [Bacteroides sp.]|nr:hypothetical protein [Bacteroides sp.]
MQGQLPEGQSQARQLSEILGIKPHSVYRKLKGEIHFSVDDLVKISDALSIPLGSLLDDHTSVYSSPVNLLAIDDRFREQDYKYSAKPVHDIFREAGKAANSRFTAICKSLPLITYYYYDWLMKFAHLRWLYFNTRSFHPGSLSEIQFPDEYRDVKEAYTEAFTTLRRLVFIVDGDMIRNFTRELLFFRKISCITPQELRYVLDDLQDMLATVEKICRKGYGATFRQEIQVFCFDISLYNDIYLVESNKFNLGIFYAHGFNPTLHKEPQTFEVIKRWVESSLRCSNFICGAGETDRKIFFEKQYRLLEEFRNQFSWSDLMEVRH